MPRTHLSTLSIKVTASQCIGAVDIGSIPIKSLRNPLTGNDGVNFQLECVIQLHYILLEVGDSHGRKRSRTNTY